MGKHMTSGNCEVERLMDEQFEAKRDEITRLLRILETDIQERHLPNTGKKLGLKHIVVSKPEVSFTEKLRTLELLKSCITSTEDAAFFAQKVIKTRQHLQFNNV